MGLILLGVIVLLVGVLLSKSGPAARFKSYIIIAGIVIGAIGLATSAIKQIEPGHVGVQKLFGKVNKDNVLPEGLHFVNPAVQVVQMSIQTQNYTMSSSYDEGMQRGDDAIRVLSQDGLEVIIDLTVLYKIIPSQAPDIYQRLGLDFQDKIIRPVTRTGIRESASEYDAIALFSEKREVFEKSILNRIQKEFKNRGFELEGLLIRNINLPKSVKESIERKITAIQEAQRMQFVLQKEEQEAERKRVEAKGNADAQRIVAQALTDKVLQFEMIKVQKELVNSPNSKIILMGGKNSPPFIIGK